MTAVYVGAALLAAAAVWVMCRCVDSILGPSDRPGHHSLSWLAVLPTLALTAPLIVARVVA